MSQPLFKISSASEAFALWHRDAIRGRPIRAHVDQAPTIASLVLLSDLERDQATIPMRTVDLHSVCPVSQLRALDQSEVHVDLESGFRAEDPVIWHHAPEILRAGCARWGYGRSWAGGVKASEWLCRFGDSSRKIRGWRHIRWHSVALGGHKNRTASDFLSTFPPYTCIDRRSQDKLGTERGWS